MCFYRVYVNFIQGIVMTSTGLFVFKDEAVPGK